MGRIGTSVALTLHEAGIGELSCNDPQKFEEEQLQVCGFSRRSDIGRPKVHVLERFFEGRPNFVFIPVVAPNQSPKVQPYLNQADIIVSCANDLDARLHIEQMAVHFGRPIVQACAQDGRHALGGIISTWMPGLNCSCFGCLFPGRIPRSQQSEVLLPTVTRALGTLAANFVMQILDGTSLALSNQQNVVALDLLSYKLEPMAISPRPGCAVCGASKSSRS